MGPSVLRAAREERLSIGEKHSRGVPVSPQKEAKQPKPSEHSPSDTKANQPSEREIAAALAARERLYGNKEEARSSEARSPIRSLSYYTRDWEYMSHEWKS